VTDFTAIRAVSKSLKTLLETYITNSNEPQLSGVNIELKSPKEMQQAQEGVGVSLWLYRVVRNGDMLNQPPERPQPNQLARRPLPLTLHYLVTPITDDPEAKQALLGRVLQVFNDHATLRGTDLQDTLSGSSDELRIALETLTVDELARVWDSLDEAYLLSVSYTVQVVEIGSDLEPVESTPVVVKETTYAQILSSI
jgi:Pvc16 N-terminal domain